MSQGKSIQFLITIDPSPITDSLNAVWAIRSDNNTRLQLWQCFPVRIPQHFSNIVIIHLPAYEDGTECSETSAYKNSDAGELPRKKYATFKTV